MHKTGGEQQTVAAPSTAAKNPRQNVESLLVRCLKSKFEYQRKQTERTKVLQAEATVRRGHETMHLFK